MLGDMQNTECFTESDPSSLGWGRGLASGQQVEESCGVTNPRSVCLGFAPVLGCLAGKQCSGLFVLSNHREKSLGAVSCVECVPSHSVIRIWGTWEGWGVAAQLART